MTPANVPPDATIAPAAAVAPTYTSAYHSTGDAVRSLVSKLNSA